MRQWERIFLVLEEFFKVDRQTDDDFSPRAFPAGIGHPDSRDATLWRGPCHTPEGAYGHPMRNPA